MRLAVVGGGPAGLRAAEVASAAGAEVTLYEAMPSVGRKFLVAGRGGLNLSKDEPAEVFARRYSAGPWSEWLRQFPLEALQAWAAGLEVELFTASTGRVYPRALRAAPLLRRWVARLRAQGVRLAVRHRWLGWDGQALRWHTPAGEVQTEADAVVLALGGASWPQTGSDGSWTSCLAAEGVAMAPWQPANAGWEVAWPAAVLAAAEGSPLKTLAVQVGGQRVRGELLVTRYGLEGGALYQLGPALRGMQPPVLEIDFKPTLSADELLRKLGPPGRLPPEEVQRRWRLSPAAWALLTHPHQPQSREDWVAAVKGCRVELRRPRPIEEAISSAGGVRWEEVDEHGMLRRRPGTFLAGEMVDWEAPTGGYLIHGCMAMGEAAARGALRWLAER